MTKYFYVRVTKKNERERGFWYNEFVGCVFLVKNNPNNRKNYVVADGCGWIEKKDSERVEVKTLKPLSNTYIESVQNQIAELSLDSSEGAKAQVIFLQEQLRRNTNKREIL